MRLCNNSLLESKEDADALADWASSAWDYMAMGDYPYPSRCGSSTARTRRGVWATPGEAGLWELAHQDNVGKKQGVAHVEEREGGRIEF
jgi:hypothetical protein